MWEGWMMSLGKWFGSWNFPFCWLLLSLKIKSKSYAEGEWGGSEMRDSEEMVKVNSYYGWCKEEQAGRCKGFLWSVDGHEPTDAAVHMAVWFFLTGPRRCAGAEIMDNLMQTYRANVVESQRSRRRNFQEDRVWRGWSRHQRDQVLSEGIMNLEVSFSLE